MDADIDFNFDPVCPFAWMTSKWVRQVRKQRDYTVDWRLISLRLINARVDYDAHFPPEHEAGHTAGLRLLRVAARTRAEHGREAVAPLYAAFGTHIFDTAPARTTIGPRVRCVMRKEPSTVMSTVAHFYPLVLGVAIHAHTRTYAVLAANGTRLGTEAFPTTHAGRARASPGRPAALEETLKPSGPTKEPEPTLGTALSDDTVLPSEAILPPADIGLGEMQTLLGAEGLIPG